MEASAVGAQGRGASRGGLAACWKESRKHPVLFQGQVLLIENLRERRESIREMLASERFAVGEIEDAREAIRLLSGGFFAQEATAPGLLICNARMLGEAGLEALEHLCANHPGLPVVLMSAFTTPKLRERMARIPGACILDQAFNLEDVRFAALALAVSRQTAF